MVVSRLLDAFGKLIKKNLFLSTSGKANKERESKNQFHLYSRHQVFSIFDDNFPILIARKK